MALNFNIESLVRDMGRSPTPRTMSLCNNQTAIFGQYALDFPSAFQSDAVGDGVAFSFQFSLFARLPETFLLCADVIGWYWPVSTPSVLKIAVAYLISP